jgi:hypothetical protein
MDSTKFNRAARVAALTDLAELRSSVVEASRKLDQFGWDSDEDMFVLTRAHIERLLEQYELGDLSDIDVEIWAESFAGRDDVRFELKYADEIRQFLFEASTPEINEPITPTFSFRWRNVFAGT